jgi:hypothetical protein
MFVSFMLIALTRRVPRTKSVFERTSSRRYSSFDYDSNGFYDDQQESMIIDNGDGDQNHLNSINSILGQNDDAIVSSNGHDDSTVSFDGDDISDEYACFILYTLFLFSLYISFLLCLDAFIFFIIEFDKF